MALIRYGTAPTHEEKAALKRMAPVEMHADIDGCTCYKKFLQLTFRIEDLQPPFDQIPNPSQADIKKHLKRIIS